jgi:hypothetical protein
MDQQAGLLNNYSINQAREIKPGLLTFFQRDKLGLTYICLMIYYLN